MVQNRIVVEAFLCDMLQLLQPMTADIRAQAVSNFLWSIAKAGLSSKSLKPCSVGRLTNRFLFLVQTPATAKQPNARGIAILLWAFAPMEHAPADEAHMQTDGLQLNTLQTWCGFLQ